MSDFAQGRQEANAILAEAKAYVDEQLRNWIGRVRVSVDGADPDVGAVHRLDFLGATATLDKPRDRIRISAGGAALPRCVATAAHSTFTPASGVETVLPLDSDGADPFDPDNWHDESTSSPYIIVPTAGDYLVCAYFAWDSSGAPATNQWNTQLWLFGGTAGTTRLVRDEKTWNWPGGAYVPPYPYHEFTYADHFAAGTKLNLQGRQDSGGATLTYAGDTFARPRLTAVKIG